MEKNANASLRSSENSLFYCICVISATPSSVLVGVLCPSSASSSVLGSHEITHIRYETEFSDDLMKIVVENLAIEYRDEGAGPVALFLHGWQNDLRTFDSLVPHLSPTHRIIRLDLPGFGKSELPPVAWHMDDYVRFVRAFLEKLHIHIGEVDAIIGHSFGGRIAIKGTAAKILQPRALVLIGSPGGGRRRTVRNAFLKSAARIGGRLLSTPPLIFWKEKLRARVYRALGSDYADAGALRETFLNVIAEDIGESAKNIKIPALLIWGEQDTEIPLADGERLLQLIPGAVLKKIRGAGHFAHQENPQEVARLMEEFFVAALGNGVSTWKPRFQV